MDAIDAKLLGATAEEALLALEGERARSAQLILLRDRKSLAYPHWRVVKAERQGNLTRIIACAFPGPGERPEP